MEKLSNKIGYFLVSNTVWIFITIIFFVSFQRIMLLRSRITSEGMTYLVLEKWVLYFQVALAAMLLFLPVLLFSYFRKTIRKKMGKWGYRILWGYCFIIHWFIFFYFGLDRNFPVFADISLVFGMPILFVELIIQLNDFLTQKLNIKQRFKQLNLEKSIIILLCFMALLFSFPPFNRSIIEESASTFFYIHEIFIDFLKWLLLFSIGYLFYRINHYLLVEKVLKTKGIFYYLLAFIGLAMLFFPIFAIIIKDYLVSEQVWLFAPNEWIPEGERDSPFRVFPTYLPWQWMLISIPIIVVYQWWQQQNEIITLEKEKSNTELNALKQQINPHFLFNTLNSLYALGIEEKSEKTADGIAKLGTLIRYNLNDAKKEMIPLKKEIDYIKKYIELQELRLTTNNQLKINIVETGHG